MRIEEATLSINMRANEELYRKLSGITGIQRLGGGIPFDLPHGPKRITLEVELETDDPVGLRGAATDTMVGDDFGFMVMECEFRLDADERLYAAVSHILGQTEDIALKPRGKRTPAEQKDVEDTLRERINNLHAGNASLRRKLDKANEEIEEMYGKWEEAVGG